MLIMIDGPENSGKTVVANELKEVIEKEFRLPAVIIKQNGRAFPDQDVYLSDFERALKDKGMIYIWDRGWPSEFVYGRILNQNRPMALDPTIGHKRFDSKISDQGIGVILSGEDLGKMDKMRDETDIQTNAALERTLFEDYGRTFGLLVLRNHFEGVDEIRKLARIIAIAAFVNKRVVPSLEEV